MENEQIKTAEPRYQLIVVLGLQPFLDHVHNFIESCGLSDKGFMITSTAEDQITGCFSNLTLEKVQEYRQAISSIDPSRLLYYGVAMLPVPPKQV